MRERERDYNELAICRCVWPISFGFEVTTTKLRSRSGGCRRVDVKHFSLLSIVCIGRSCAVQMLVVEHFVGHQNLQVVTVKTFVTGNTV